MKVRPHFAQRHGCPLAGRRGGGWFCGCCGALALAAASWRCTFSFSQ
jgi:hypothetical protein